MDRDGEKAYAERPGVGGPESVWSCKVGVADRAALPAGADSPLRGAVEKAYRELTGRDADFLFSGWGAELDAEERRAVLDHAQTQREVAAAPSDAPLDEIDAAAEEVASLPPDAFEKFCEAQRTSHERLQRSDPDYAEFHRGAKTTYDVVLRRLRRRLDNPHISAGCKARIDTAQAVPRPGASDVAARTVTPSPIHAQLDEAGIRRYDDEGTPQRRILTLQERIEILLRNYAARQVTIDGLAATVNAQANRLDQLRFVASPGTDGEDKEEETEDVVSVGYLKSEIARLLEGREEARTREGRFAEERDCAFALLRWLLPVTVAKRLDDDADLTEFVASWHPEPEPGEVREEAVEDGDDRPVWRIELDRALNHLRNVGMDLLEGRRG